MRGRRIATAGLVGLTCVLVALAAVAVWLRTLVLDTNAYVRAIGPVLDHAEVRDELAQKIVDELYAHVDVTGLLQDALPKAADAFAPTLAASIRSTSIQLASSALATAPVRRVWKDANRIAHEQLVKVLEDKGRLVSTTNGTVAINTAGLAAEVRHALDAAGVHVFDSVPVETLDGQFVLFRSSNLLHAQMATRVLDDLSTWLPIATIASGAGALACSTRRRRTVQYLAIGVAGAMVTITVGIAVGRAYYLDTLQNTVSRAVAAAPFDALVVPLRAGVRVMFLVALGVWVATWFAGAQTMVEREERIRALVLDRIRQHARPLAISGGVVAAVVLVGWDRPRPITVAGIVGVLAVWEAICVAAARRAPSV